MVLQRSNGIRVSKGFLDGWNGNLYKNDLPATGFYAGF